jgi:hypothetical protein
MLSVEFELAIPAIEQLQIYALDCTVTGLPSVIHYVGSSIVLFGLHSETDLLLSLRVTAAL